MIAFDVHTFQNVSQMCHIVLWTKRFMRKLWLFYSLMDASNLVLKLCECFETIHCVECSGVNSIFSLLYAEHFHEFNSAVHLYLCVLFKRKLSTIAIRYTFSPSRVRPTEIFVYYTAYWIILLRHTVKIHESLWINLFGGIHFVP